MNKTREGLNQVEETIFYDLLAKYWLSIKEDKMNENDRLAEAMADEDDEKVEEILNDMKQDFLDNLFSYLD